MTVGSNRPARRFLSRCCFDRCALRLWMNLGMSFGPFGCSTAFKGLLLSHSHCEAQWSSDCLLSSRAKLSQEIGVDPLCDKWTVGEHFKNIILLAKSCVGEPHVDLLLAYVALQLAKYSAS